MSRRRSLIVALAGALVVTVALLAHLAIQRQLQTVAPAPSPSPSPTLAPLPTATPEPTVAPTATPEPTAVSTPTTAPSPTTAVSPTATPAPPTPTPTPGPIVTNDKLGVGVYSPVGINVLRTLRPAMILVMDPNIGSAPELRTVFPRALIVGRKYIPDHDPLLADCNNPAEDHRAKGAALADVIAQTAAPLRNVVNAWVGDNEQASGTDPAQLTCHAQYETGFVEQLQGKYHIDAVAGNDASGAVEPADYAKYFAKPISEAAYFGIHAYGKPQSRHLNNGPESIYYALRYRLIHDELAKVGAMPKNGFLLTETGVYEGWRGLVPDDQMAQDFIWLEQETEKDDYLKGQFMFGIGTQGSQSIFELEGTHLLDLLGSFNLQHAGTYP